MNLRKVFSFAFSLLLPAFAGAAAVASHGGLMLPYPYGPAASSMLIDGSAEKASFIVQVPVTGNISKVLFRTGTVGTSDTLYVGIYTVDGAGAPTTTAYGGMATGTVSGLVSNTTYTVTLGTPAAAVRGNIVAVVIGFNSYVAGNLNIVYNSVTNGLAVGFPYVNHFTASWSKINGIPIMGLEYDDGSYKPFGPVDLLTGTVSSHAYGSASSPDEYALKFQVPFPTTVEGVMLPFNASTDHPIILYDSSSVILTSVTISSNTMAYAGSPRFMFAKFPVSTNITANTVYRLSLLPGASNVTAYKMTAPSVAAMGALPGGANFIMSTRTDAGSWTDATTSVILFYPIFGSFSDGAGGGGGYKAMFMMD